MKCDVIILLIKEETPFTKRRWISVPPWRQSQRYFASTTFNSSLSLLYFPAHRKFGSDSSSCPIGPQSPQDPRTQLESWDELQLHNTTSLITDSEIVIQRLSDTQHSLSPEAIAFLCSYNNVRRDGNYYGCTATQGEIKEAIETKPLYSQERDYLERLYNFVFDTSI